MLATKNMQEYELQVVAAQDRIAVPEDVYKRQGTAADGVSKEPAQYRTANGPDGIAIVAALDLYGCLLYTSIRPNFTTKLNSDSRTRVCISNVSERNGEADTE